MNSLGPGLGWLRAALISSVTLTAAVVDGGKGLAMVVVVLISEVAAKGTLISKSDEIVSCRFAEALG